MRSTIRDYSELPVTLSIEQVGSVLGVSRKTAYNLARSKGFPVVRIGEKRLIVPKAKFIEWLNSKADQSIK